MLTFSEKVARFHYAISKRPAVKYLEQYSNAGIGFRLSLLRLNNTFIHFFIRISKRITPFHGDIIMFLIIVNIVKSAGIG